MKSQPALSRRALLGAVLVVAVAPATACSSSWTYNLQRSGAFEGALRHLRDANPGRKASEIVVTLPSVVTATMVADDGSVVTAVWDAGTIEVKPGGPDGEQAHPDSELFELSDPYPRIADVRFEAQLATGAPELDRPELTVARFWVEGQTLQVRADLTGGHEPIVFAYEKAELVRSPAT